MHPGLVYAHLNIKMNDPAGQSKFMPRQALTPTPSLYGELVGDSMEQLAAASMGILGRLRSGSVLHDVGCGLGAGTAAVLAATGSDRILVKGTDINNESLSIYTERATNNGWPAEGSLADATALDFDDETFSHSLANALLFVLPNDGIGAVREMYRTLKPGGVAIMNCWASTPTLHPIAVAASKTRPIGTPLPRQGAKQWEDSEFLQSVIAKGGFSLDKISLTKRNIRVRLGDIRHFATMLWSFIGGTSAAGWLETDEENWEQAIDIVVDELRKSRGYNQVDADHFEVQFQAHIAIATK